MRHNMDSKTSCSPWIPLKFSILALSHSNSEKSKMLSDIIEDMKTGNRLHIFVSFRMFSIVTNSFIQFSMWWLLLCIMHIENKPQAQKEWKSFLLIIWITTHTKKRRLNSGNEQELNPVGWHCSEINTNCWFHYNYYYLDLSTSRLVSTELLFTLNGVFWFLLLQQPTICFTLSPCSQTEFPLVLSLQFSLNCFALLRFVPFALNLFICFQLLLLPENILLFLHTIIHSHPPIHYFPYFVFQFNVYFLSFLFTSTHNNWISCVVCNMLNTHTEKKERREST